MINLLSAIMLTMCGDILIIRFDNNKDKNKYIAIACVAFIVAGINLAKFFER